MDVKQAVGELFDAAKARTVRFPKGSDWNEAKVRQTCGATLLSVPRKEDGSLDVDCALATMIEQYGVEKESEADQKKRKAEDEAEDDAEEGEGEEGGSPSKKKGKKPKDPPKKETVEVEANRTVAYAFQEMADIYWKNGERMKGGAYSKSAKAIRESTDELLTAKQVMKLKIKGLGKGSAEKIEEFREKGFIQKLEDLRSGTA